MDENLVVKLWKNRDFRNLNLRSIDGREIEVLFIGVENENQGADFKRAQIQIDGKICSGDVEIHVKSSDWVKHKHHIDPMYNSVILHVAMWHDSKTLMTKRQDDKRIPIIELSKQFNLDYDCDRTELIRSNPYQKYRVMERGKLANLLDEMGELRFEDKVKRFETRFDQLDQLDFDKKTFEQLIYEGLFEAAGYAKNRIPFLKLLSLTRSIDRRDRYEFGSEALSATLLGCAGLLPSQNPEPPKLRGEALKISNQFQKIWELKRGEFNLSPLSRDSWKLLKVRPNNSPIRRIVAISEILAYHKDKLFLRFLELINRTESDDRKLKVAIKNSRSILMPEVSGFWAYHFDFDKSLEGQNRLLIGKNRADDIIVNVVLPLLYLYAKLKSDRSLQTLQSLTKKLYAAYPKLQDNFITRRLKIMIFQDKAEADLIVNSARRQQGLIHIYYNYNYSNQQSAISNQLKIKIDN